MDREYAYIDVGARDTSGSESAVQAWLDKLLQSSDLKQEAKDLIHARTPLPVEFSVFEEHGDEAEPQALIVEREPVELWHILNNRFPWKTFVSKRQSSRALGVAVQMPRFFDSVAPRLNASRFFLDSIRVSGQFVGSTWQRYSFALPPRALADTEVVLLSVWGVSKRLLAEIWFDVPLILLGQSQWPRAIASAWSGMRIGSRSGESIRYSEDTEGQDLWLKPFNEAVLEADISLYPRWMLKSLILPAEDLKTDEVVEVTITEPSGKVERSHYVVSIPEAFRQSSDWHYYLGVYINHRCAWVHYGLRLSDGTLLARRGYDNQWHVRCDVSQLSIEIRISPRELIHWSQTPAVAVSPPDSSKTWQRWSELATGVGSTQLPLAYIQSLISRSLAASGLPAATQNAFKAEQRFRFKYLAGHVSYSAGVMAYVPPRYQYFSFEQILVGEPQRSAYFQEFISAVHVRGEPLSAGEVRALTGMRDRFLADFAADVEQLANQGGYKALFNETCDALAKVRAGRFLADDQEIDRDLQGCALRFLKGELKARLLLFKEKLVPNVLVLKFDSQKALLISLNATESKWVVWRPSPAPGQPSEVLMKFIVEHLGFAEKSNITRGDFVLQKRRYGYHYRRVPPEPITFRESGNINGELLEAALNEIKQQMNYAVFSSNEERRRAQLGLFKSALRAVSTLVIVAVSPVSGLGALLAAGAARMVANIGDVGLTYALAQETDRPERYAAYAAECKLGVLLGLVDLSADILGASQQLRVLLKQSSQAGRLLAPLIIRSTGSAMPIPQEQSSDSELFLATPSWLHDLRHRLEKAYQDDHKIDQFKRCLQRSVTSGYAESKACAEYLLSKSWDVQVIGVLIFRDPADERPQSHYALSVRHQGDAAVIDLALGHLDSAVQGRAYLGSLEAWSLFLRERPVLRGKVVVYKLYSSFVSASHELDSLFSFGMSTGRFFDRGSYTVAAFPSPFIPQVQGQLQRLWACVFERLRGGSTDALPFSQTEMLSHISNIKGLIDEGEDALRRSVGGGAIEQLRIRMLEIFQRWRSDSMDGYRELMDQVVAEEARLVQYTLSHLQALQQGLTAVPASETNAVVDCVDWISSRCGLRDESWRVLLREQIDAYVSGSQAAVDLSLIAELDRLYEKLARDKQVQFHHARWNRYERLSETSSRALFNIGLGLMRTMDAPRQSESLFALILGCQPYDNSNEHFAWIVYGISALRHQQFTVLTLAHELRLSGLEPVGSLVN